MTSLLGLGAPLSLNLSVTIGCDCQFVVNRVDSNGAPLAFGATVSIEIIPTTGSSSTVWAVVSGSDATFTIPHSTCDGIKNGTAFVVSMTDATPVTTPLIVGQFLRNDG